MGLLQLLLAEVLPATPRSRLLRLDLKGHTFPFEAGQAVLVGPRGRDRRPFSIANSPEDASRSGRLELLVGTDGEADTSWVVTGSTMDVEGPLGEFTFTRAPRTPHILFVAGGVGIAPLRSMLHEALGQSHAPRITLLYSARRRDEFAFIDEFQTEAQRGRIRLRQAVTRDGATEWDGWRGRVGRDEFGAVLEDVTGTTCFVCGPASLVSHAVETLRSLGVPHERLRTEQWGG